MRRILVWVCSWRSGKDKEDHERNRRLQLRKQFRIVCGARHGERSCAGRRARSVALMAEGLDPWWGFYHRPRHGRPALALDAMEEFRPLVADSSVLTAINTGMVQASDFETGKSGCLMKPGGRKSLIQAYEQRLDQFVTHPVFDYRCSWRSVIRLQARLLTKWLRGDVPAYVGITTR